MRVHVKNKKYGILISHSSQRTKMQKKIEQKTLHSWRAQREQKNDMALWVLLESGNNRPVYTTSVLGTAPLKMGTRAQNFRHGTSVFCRVNVTKPARVPKKLKVPRLSHEVVSVRLTIAAPCPNCHRIQNNNVRACAKQFVFIATWRKAMKNYNLSKRKRK